MHFGLTHVDELNADTDVIYRTIVFFSEDKFVKHNVPLKLSLLLVMGHLLIVNISECTLD